MSNEFRHNHYVPEWYQKRFIPDGQQHRELYYLDLEPGYFVDPRGMRHKKRQVKRTGVKNCFAQDDLYTTRFRGAESTEIEKSFFGKIDSEGRKAVEYFTAFSYPLTSQPFPLNEMLMYMSTQRLRTPKGLAWLSMMSGTKKHNFLLRLMINVRYLHCAIWTECVWLIADATKSDTKFIISDHPVTVYNRGCNLKSIFCKGVNDPDIRFHATHTIFPLSLEKILILTNLSWVRNPYQPERDVRPNPDLFRPAMMKLTDIQTLRHLEEQEVREINFIIKSRALRYVAASKEQWLYPELYVSAKNWYRYGNGYLLMPDPRSVQYGGEIFWSSKDGTYGAIDEYGHRPWQAGYRDRNDGVDKDWYNYLRFQGKFARLFGPFRRSRAFSYMALDPERDSDEHHQHRIKQEFDIKRAKTRKRKD